jgi:hypothetical protein
VGGFFVGIKPLEFNVKQRELLSRYLIDVAKGYALIGLGAPITFNFAPILKLTVLIIYATFSLVFLYFSLLVVQEKE